MPADVWQRIDGAMVTAIQETNLLPIVQSQLFPDVSAFTDAQFPAGCVSEEGLVPRKLGYTSKHVEWEYPCNFWILDKTPEHAKKWTYITTLMEIRDLFNGKILDGVEEVQFCEVDFNMVIDRRLPQYMHAMAGLVARFRTRELRQ